MIDLHIVFEILGSVGGVGGAVAAAVYVPPPLKSHAIALAAALGGMLWAGSYFVGVGVDAQAKRDAVTIADLKQDIVNLQGTVTRIDEDSRAAQKLAEDRAAQERARQLAEVKAEMVKLQAEKDAADAQAKRAREALRKASPDWRKAPANPATICALGGPCQ